MKKIEVSFNKEISSPEISKALRSYNIYIGNGLLEKAEKLLDLDKYSSVIILADGNLGNDLIDRLRRPLERAPIKTKVIKVPSGEKNKTLETVGKIAEQMRDFGADRKSLVINFGGGVTGDMGGLIAGIYMRGIDFAHVPTTLLAMVDASIGGKTAVDLEKYKNILGLVIQPTAVIMDVDVLETLPERQIQNGMAEIIKHGLILDKEFFEKVTGKDFRMFGKEELIEILAKNSEIKSSIIIEDPMEKGKRKILNFGHTIGHAVESLSLKTDNPLFHGDAVSIGMVAEANISKEMGLLSDGEFKQIVQVLKKAGLPISYSGLNKDEVRKLMRSDKKTDSGELNLSLLRGIGNCIYNQQPSEEIVAKGIDYVIS
jgi:3-dehydroquinate synthase